MLELSLSTTEIPEDLVRKLTQLQLCKLADVRKARSSVRHLARELPPFDSVWIDALVQLRKLTPFQARRLESGSADDLRIGNYVVVDELGHGPHGTTLLARTLGRHDRVVLKRLTVPVESIPDCRQRLVQFVDRCKTWTHPNVASPIAVLPGNPLVIVSPWVQGLTLSELLVRRGRFPASMVQEIGRQVASGLAVLHQAGLVHGDLGLANIRLTDHGLAVLVDGGIRSVVCPELTIHATLALEAYDTVAPELIGTGIGPNASSEIYALGCLLWKLLTGRPPYAMADPLMKLAAHQTRRIADVRTLAPDTPPALADTILSMTSPDINERPRSFDELIRRWGRPSFSSRSRLKSYRKNFDGAVPHFAQPGKPLTDSRWPWMAASLFVVAGMALTFADKGLRNEVLSISRRIADAVQTNRSNADATSNENVAGPGTQASPSQNGLLSLPAPSADGEILLTAAGPYDVARVAVASDRDLVIRGAAGASPVIQIGRESLWLSAKSIRLENVRFQANSSIGQMLPAMILARSQQLTIQNCAFARATEAESASLPANSTAIAWRPQETDSADSRQVDVSNSVFRAAGAAVWMAEMPEQVRVANVLKLDQGPCFAVSPKASVHDCSFDIANLTLRDSGPLLRLAGTFAEQASSPTVEFTVQDSLFALTPDAGLIELQTAKPRQDIERSIRMTGHGSVLAPGANLMVVANPVRQSTHVVDADEQFEGLVVSELQFKGKASGPVSDSQLEHLTAPRSAADQSPGIAASKLPAIR